MLVLTRSICAGFIFQLFAQGRVEMEGEGVREKENENNEDESCT